LEAKKKKRNNSRYEVKQMGGRFSRDGDIAIEVLSRNKL
jgi:hypothetical protein